MQFNYIINNNGIDSLQSYPYKASKESSCKFNPYYIAAKISGFETIFNDELKMKIAIDTIGPIIVFLSSNPLKKYQRVNSQSFYLKLIYCSLMVP